MHEARLNLVQCVPSGLGILRTGFRGIEVAAYRQTDSERSTWGRNDPLTKERRSGADRPERARPETVVVFCASVLSVALAILSMGSGIIRTAHFQSLPPPGGITTKSLGQAEFHRRQAVAFRPKISTISGKE